MVSNNYFLTIKLSYKTGCYLICSQKIKKSAYTNKFKESANSRLLMAKCSERTGNIDFLKY
jgi:hypothetical protein